MVDRPQQADPHQRGLCRPDPHALEPPRVEPVAREVLERHAELRPEVRIGQRRLNRVGFQVPSQEFDQLGARVLGLDAEIGSLEPGKAADMMAIDLSDPKFQPLYDPIAQIIHTTAGTCVSHVWVAGKCLLDDGQLNTLDADRVVHAAREWRDRILA